MSRARFVVCLLFLPLLLACGGGSGVIIIGPFGPTIFVGTYEFTNIAFFAGSSAEAEIGVASPDGVSSLTTSDNVRNDDGTITIGTGMTVGYSVDGAGNMCIFDPLMPTDIFAEGGITADGRCALVGNAEAGSDPGIIPILKRSATVTTADFTGGYHLGYFFAASTDAGAGWWMITMNGAGSATIDGGTENDGGLIQVFAPGGLLPYTVLAGGRITATFFGIELRGAAADGGSFAILGGDIAPLPGMDQGPLLAVLVKKAVAATNATLTGDYWIAGTALEPVTPVSSSFYGSATANGAGALSVKTKTNTEGVLTDDPVDNGYTYAVGADGSLTVTTSTGIVLHGGVTADGKFGFASGGDMTGDDVMFILFCRKN